MADIAAAGITSPKVWRIRARECERAQRQVAATLLSLGLRAGDRVAFACQNSPEYLAAILGALRVGIVPVLLNPGLHPHERDALVADAEPGRVVHGAAELSRLFTADEAELAPWPLGRPMHYTSGTSGRPKGVWSGVLTEGDAAAMFADEADLWEYAADDVHLACSPLWHSATVRFSASALLRGGEVVLVERFDARAVVKALAEERPTTAFAVPTHLQRIFALGDEMTVSSLRRLIHAGEPCPAHVKREALARFPPGTVWEFYGSTEGQFTICSPTEWQERPGTVGRARPGRDLSVDDEDAVWCRPPRFARFEYWRDPVKTAEAWRAGAFSVGDAGRLDQDGYLFLAGRREDLIITGGVNVYPVEVEAVLATLPGIREVAVFGVDDERWGERVCAAVVGNVTAQDVMAHARSSLAGYKCPKSVYLVDDFPRTSTGKVRRQEIRGRLGI